MNRNPEEELTHQSPVIVTIESFGSASDFYANTGVTTLGTVAAYGNDAGIFPLVWSCDTFGSSNGAAPLLLEMCHVKTSGQAFK